MESWDLSNGPWNSPGAAIRRILEARGHSVAVVDNHRSYLPGGKRTTWEYSRMQIRVGWRDLNDAIVNRKVLAAAQSFQPDLALLSKCENLWESTILGLQRTTQAVIINWMHDNPFYWSNTSMGLLRSLRHYDVFATYIRGIIPTLEMVGCPRVEYVPLYAEPSYLNLDTVLSEQDRHTYACDVALVANWSPIRERTVECLADLDFAIWGSGWERVRPGSPLRRCIRGRPALGSDYAKALLGARVGVNVVNQQNLAGTNCRVFEVTALGRLLVTNYGAEVADELFQDGKEVVCYRSPEELRGKVAYYLDHPDEREQIARAGQERTLREHTLEQRVLKLLVVAGDVAGRMEGARCLS